MSKRSRQSKKKKLNTTRTWLLQAGAIGLVVIGFAIVIISSANRPDTGVSADVDVDGDTLAMGERVYNEQCASCHGDDGEGQTVAPAGQQMPAPPHDETGHTWHHSDEFLFDYTKYGGQAGMPAYEDILTDEEIEAVLLYIEQWWTPEQRAQQNTR